MEIKLPAHLEQFVFQQVESGIFATPSDAVCQAVESWKSRESKLQSLREQIQIGEDQIDRGECIQIQPGKLSEFFESLKQEVFEQLQLERAAP